MYEIQDGLIKKKPVGLKQPAFFKIEFSYR